MKTVLSNKELHSECVTHVTLPLSAAHRGGVVIVISASGRLAVISGCLQTSPTADVPEEQLFGHEEHLDLTPLF